MSLTLKVILGVLAFCILSTAIYVFFIGGLLWMVHRDVSGYDVQKNQVFYQIGANQKLEVKNADASSFEILKSGQGRYGKDRSFFYHKGNRIEGVDAGSFQPLEIDQYGTWAKDKNKIYYDGVAIDQVIPATFKVISSDFIADQAHVFYRKPARQPTERDRYQVVEGAKPASFQMIKNEWSEEYSKDADAVFFQETKVENADPKTFKVLDGGYAADSKAVYYNGKIVSGADAASIQVVENVSMVVKDKSFFYSEGKKGTLKDGEFVAD